MDRGGSTSQMGVALLIMIPDTKMILRSTTEQIEQLKDGQHLQMEQIIGLTLSNHHSMGLKGPNK